MSDQYWEIVAVRHDGTERTLKSRFRGTSRDADQARASFARHNSGIYTHIYQKVVR